MAVDDQDLEKLFFESNPKSQFTLRHFRAYMRYNDKGEIVATLYVGVSGSVYLCAGTGENGYHTYLQAHNVMPQLPKQYHCGILGAYNAE